MSQFTREQVIEKYNRGETLSHLDLSGIECQPRKRHPAPPLKPPPGTGYCGPEREQRSASLP